MGKTTTARLIAKSLNCERRQPDTSEPCNECNLCHDITRGGAIDVIEIDAASHTEVETVRETIIANAQFQPTSAKYKIFIIDEVHMLSTSAFNALLKTLEEPPARTIFILATTELHKLPSTIISRCQRFVSKKIPRTLMNEHFSKIAKAEGVTIAPEVIARLTRASEGSARDAVSLLDQIIATSGSTVTAETVDDTGHDGSMSTVHANDTRETLDRLELMIALSGVDLPARIARQYVCNAIDIVIHVTRLHTGERRITKISEVAGLKDGKYRMDDIFVYRIGGEDKDGRPVGSFFATGYQPVALRRLAMTGANVDQYRPLFEARELKME